MDQLVGERDRYFQEYGDTQRASLSYVQREQQVYQGLRGEVATWKEAAEQNLFEIKVQQQISQQELVHVPQQEVVSEHQGLMDQLLGVAPTVPCTNTTPAPPDPSVSLIQWAETLGDDEVEAEVLGSMRLMHLRVTCLNSEEDEALPAFDT
eukprot:5483896-Amphidinium_carterae.1